MPGKFLLIGSANLLAHPKVTESLAGRIDVLYLEGLSLSEWFERKKPSPLFEILFRHDDMMNKIKTLKTYLKNTPDFDRTELFEAIFLAISLK